MASSSSSIIPADATPAEVMKALGNLVVKMPGGVGEDGVPYPKPAAPPTSTDGTPPPQETATDPTTPTTPDSVSNFLTVPKPLQKFLKKNKRVTKPLPCPDLKVFVGHFVHCTSSGEFVVMNDRLIGVEKGKIVFLENSNQLDNIIDNYKIHDWESQCVIRMEHGSFMMPGLVDCYCQPLSTLSSAFSRTDHSITASSPSSKMFLISDDRLARRHLRRVVDRALACGTTCALYNGSTIESAARLLADSVGLSQQRAYVGFDVSCVDYRDDTHIFQLTKAWDIIQYIKRTQAENKIEACLIMSHPMPSWLQDRLQDMRDKEDIPIVCSAHYQSEDAMKQQMGHWVHFEEKSPLQFLKASKLIDDKSLLVHGQHMSGKDRKIVGCAGSQVVYCPSHDLAAAPYWTNIKALTSANICSGIGSDTRNKNSVLGAIQDYHLVQQLQQRVPRPAAPKPPPRPPRQPVIKQNGAGDGIQTEEEEEEEEEEEWTEEGPGDVNMAQIFYMATLGGAKALGLADKIGNFEIGKEFDAILVNTMTARSPFLGVHRKDSIADLLQKFLLLGDDHNVSHVYIRGIRVK